MENKDNPTRGLRSKIDFADETSFDWDKITAERFGISRDMVEAFLKVLEKGGEDNGGTTNNESLREV